MAITAERNSNRTDLWQDDGAHQVAGAGRAQQAQGVQEGQPNVGDTERHVSFAAGSILALLGIAKRDIPGAIIALVGGGLIQRAVTGRCSVYQKMDIDTTKDEQGRAAEQLPFHVVRSYLIDKSPQELYAYWRKLENLPKIMSHLESVQVTDGQRSHWVAKAPRIAGGKVEWDAEITADEPDARIAWQSLPGAQVDNRGSVQFTKAPGDRGTMLRVEIDYRPPAGRLGKWIATLFGENPSMQVAEDLRRFKRQMENGEVPTTEGQPRGTCMGKGTRS